MSEAPQDAKGIFLAALDISDTAERAAFVERTCGDDAALRQRVHDLLRAYGQPGGPLDKLAAALASTEVPEPIREHVGATIGPYKLMEQIGEGGFGLVFVAEQERPIRRKVALKIIKPGMDTRDVIARFEAERQALALMDHPNIARVLDAGTTESGRPYFVMELVRGVPITEYCDKSQLTPRERLELFVEVCHALQHAHQKGIIHRDIKPSNVLVTLHDGRPVVKVIDFGVAKALYQKLTEQTIYTRFAQMIGTPLYMSPEQAEMSGLEIDTRSDVYSLGVLMYELLTGTTPFDKQRLAKAAYVELIRIIREEEPPKPSTRLSQSTATLSTIAAQRRTEPAKLSRIFRGDLDWITMKALEKDRTRRYGTARELAEDIERWSRGDPIVAKPPTLRYLLGKYVRRNRIPIAVAAAVLVALIGGTIFEFYLINRERRDAIESRRQEAKARGAAEAATKVAQLRETEAREQKDRAQAALQEVERQRKIAEQNFRETRQTVDKYFTLISESRLIDVPGAEPLREGLLRAALDYYQKYKSYSKTESDDAEIQAELAASYCRMANIENVTGAGEWLPTFEKGVAIVERLVNAKTPIEKFKSLNAGVADVSARHSAIDPGILSAARQTFERAVRAWGKLVEASPTSEGFRHDWAYLSDVVTTIKLSQSNDPKVLADVLAGALQTREIWQKLAAEHPEKPHYRAAVVLEDCALASIYLRQMDPSAATIALRRAEALGQALVNDFPAIPQFRDHLARVYNYRWGLHYLAKNVPAEVESLRKWLVVLSKMVADFPTVPAYRTSLEGAQKQCRTMAGVYVYSDQPVRTKDLLAFLDLYAEIVANGTAEQPARRGFSVGRNQQFDNGPVGFPSITPYLDGGGLELIKKGLDKLAESERGQLLAQISARAKAGGHGANTYKLAEVAALWWNDDRAKAVSRLEDYARRMPDDVSFQLALSRARAARGAPRGPTGAKRDDSLESLFAALRNSGSNPEGARQIIASIRRSDPNGERSQERWLELLSNEDGVLRRVALRGLPSRLLAAPAIASVLKQSLTDGDIGARIAACERFWELNHTRDQVVPILAACLAEASAANRSAAAAALAEIGHTAEMRPALFAALIMPDTPAEDLAEILKAIERVDPNHAPTASDWEKLHLQASPAVRKAVAAAIDLALSDNSLDIRTVEPVVRARLKQPYPESRVLSAVWLLKLPADRTRLLAMIESDFSACSQQIRLRLIEKLESLQMGSSAVRPILTKALADPDAKVRIAAITKLGPQLGDRQWAKALVEIVQTNFSGNDIELFRVLAAAGPNVHGALPTLLHAAPGYAETLKFARAEANVSFSPLIQAIRPIDSRGTLAVPRWIALAGDNRAAVRQMALDQLTSYGPAARGALSTARGCLRDSNVLVRVFAARLLWNLTREVQDVLPVLVEALDVPALNPQVSLTAAAVSVETLAEIGPPAKEALPDLRRRVRQAGKKVSWLAIQAANAAWSIEPTRENAVLLFNALQESGALKASFNGWNYSTWRDLLDHLGSAARDAAPALVSFISNRWNQLSPQYEKYDGTKRELVATLSTIDPKGDLTLNCWSRLLKHENPRSRSLAAHEIGLFGETAQKCVPGLRGCLTDGDEDVRLAAAIALWNVARAPEAASAIKERLQSLIHTPVTTEKRTDVLDGIDHLRTAAQELLPTLVALLAREDPDGESWGEIAGTINLVDPEGRRSRPLIAALFKDGRASARKTGLRWFSEYAPWDEGYQSNVRSALIDPDAGVRVQAAALVSRFPKGERQAIPVLIRALTEDNSEVSAQAVKEMASLGIQGREVAPALRAALSKSTSLKDRLSILNAAWSVTRDGEFSQFLVAEIKRQPLPIDDKAFEMLTKMGSHAKSALPLLTQWLDEKSDFAGADSPAFDALAQADPDGKAGARYLEYLLDCGSPNRRVDAIETARRAVWNTNPLAETLGKALAGSDRYLAMNAAAALIGVEDRRENATAVLIDCLDDGIAANRAFAAHLLAGIGPKAAVATTRLQAALRDPDADVRRVAAQALWKVARDTSGAALLAEQPYVYNHSYTYTYPPEANHQYSGYTSYEVDAIASLHAMGSAASGAAEQLLNNVASLRWNFYSDVFNDLITTVDPQGLVALPRARELLKDDRPQVRLRAASLLGKYALQARAAEPALRTALNDRSPEVRAAVVEALWNTTHDRTLVMPSVVALLKDRDENVRMAAIKTLESMGLGLPDFVKLLEPLSTDLTIDVRVAAARALWKAGGTIDSLQPAIETCLKSPDPGTAISLVGEIGPPARFAEPLLVVFAERATDMPTRVMAAVALAQVLGRNEVAARRINVEMQHGLVEVLQLLKADKAARKMAVPILTDKLASVSTSPVEKEQIIGLLGEVGAPATAAVPVLQALAKSTRDAARQALIAEALAKIDSLPTSR